MSLAAGRRLLVLLWPYGWLLALFLLPFLVIVAISLAESRYAVPPYSPLVSVEQGLVTIRLNLENYRSLFEDSYYVLSFIGSLRIAALATLLSLAAGYPLAYAMSRAPRHWQGLLVMLVIIPFWTSSLIRVYAWIGILKDEGYLNHLLMASGLISAPLTILYTEAAVLVGIVYTYLPFVILPVYASLQRFDHSLLEAAADLGCGPVRTFWTITFPVSLPGVAAGCFLVFLQSIGEFVIPDILGGANTLMTGKTLWTEFFNARNWPGAAAIAVLLLLVVIGPIAILQRSLVRRGLA